MTAEQLDAARQEQLRTGGQLGRILLLHGACTRLALYNALARRWDRDFVNLLFNAPDPDLMHMVDPTVMLAQEWVPWRAENGGVVIATSRDPQAAAADAARHLPPAAGPVTRVVITTDWDITQVVARARRDSLVHTATELLAEDNPDASAKNGIVRWQRSVMIAFALLLVAGLVVNAAQTLVTLIVAANLVFLVAVGFKILAALAGGVHRVERTRAARRYERLTGLHLHERVADTELPVYTILVPVYHEANVVEHVIDHLGQLDWPKSKLQVLILTEENDTETINAVKDSNPPEYVRLLVVPDGQPRTKPRACNFGLMFAQGEYLVIFDAEDRPDPDQLRRVIAEFAVHDAIDQGTPTVCLQAALNYFNWDTNLLTRLFTLEYSSWFDGMLPGMDFMHLPIPLGGTSNHFRTALLRDLGGWDPYNVTEDADLGMRASSAGYKVGVVDSTTWEEACSKTHAWIRQRTRWIKGYMVTALVDMRYPREFTRKAGPRSLATMLGLIIGTPLMFLAYPLVWGMTLATYVGLPMARFTMPDWMTAFTIWNAIIGNLAMIAVAAWTGGRRHGWRLAPYALLNPLYWFMHAWAAWRAAFQLIVNPHMWEKTPHGLTHDRVEVSAVR